MPNLIIRLLQWIANRKGSWEIQEVYRRLPKLEMSNDGHPILGILGIDVDFTPVVDALRTEPLTPVLDSIEPQIGDLLTSDPSEVDHLIARRLVIRPDQSTYKFVKVDECRFVPDAFLADLAPHFIRHWLGGFYPFAFSTKDPAGHFFYSMGILGEPSDKEWESTTDNYQKILQLLPENVRAWVVIHAVAATLRSKGQQYAPSIPLMILPNGRWQLCAINTLNPAAYQYYGSLEKDVREILVLDPKKTPALALMLALMRTPEKSNEKHHIDANAIINMFWPIDKGKLRDITEPLFEKEAEDNREDMIHRVVAVTEALRKLTGGNNAVTHILATKDGKLRLLPKNEVWVGAAYGFSHIEEAAAGEIPIVASNYGQGTEWEAFFVQECQTYPQVKWQIIKEVTFDCYHEISGYEFGEIRKLEKKSFLTTIELPSELEEKTDEEEKTGKKVFKNTLNYLHILSTNLDPWDKILENSELTHARACKFAITLLSKKIYYKKDFQISSIGGKESFLPYKIYVLWIGTEKRRYFKPSSKIFPKWINLLRERAWVPTKDGGVLSPKDVLLRKSEENPDAPLADLDEEIL